MFAIANARVVSSSGEVIEGGVVIIDGGKVVAAGLDVNIPKGTPVRDWDGRVLNAQVIAHVSSMNSRQAKHFCSIKPWRGNR